MPPKKKISTKHKEYEETAKRKQVLSIRTSKSDNADDWAKIVSWLQNKGEGDAKTGLFKLAEDNGVLQPKSGSEIKDKS
jgi:hypothetical protein